VRGLAERLTSPYDLRTGPGRTIGLATASLSVAAGLIHVSAAVEHSDLPAMMIGFEIVAVLQVGLGALLVWGRPRRTLLAAGVALMAIAVGLWLVSRTAGLGFLVDGAHLEPVGFKDGVTVLFELLAIAGLVLLIEPRGMRVALPDSWLATPWLGLAAVAACALFVPALVTGGHDHALTQVASVHEVSGGAMHPGDGHANARSGGAGHRRGHAEGGGKTQGRPHPETHSAHVADATAAHSHGTELAVAHSHVPSAAVAPVHDHSLAAETGVAAGSGHEHTGGATTGAGEDLATHPPGHEPGYGSDGGAAPQEPSPPPSQGTPAPGLGGPVEGAGEVLP
jgi:hypothetical protein